MIKNLFIHLYWKQLLNITNANDKKADFCVILSYLYIIILMLFCNDPELKGVNQFGKTIDTKFIL